MMILNNLVDIHTHILPGIDDGAGNMEITQEMISIAYKDGIRTIIFTPHYDARRFFNTKNIILNKIEELRPWLSEKYPDLIIYPGCELYYSHTAVEKLISGEIQTMADSEYVLVEFPTSVTPTALKSGLQDILYKGYTPILAHVERYQEVFHDIEYLYSLKQMGVHIQVNASTITGEVGFFVKMYVKKLVNNSIIDFIATDAHSTGRRSPRLQECALYIEKKFGKELAERLFIKNPQKLIHTKEK